MVTTSPSNNCLNRIIHIPALQKIRQAMSATS
jgi:hypothetical protein